MTQYLDEIRKIVNDYASIKQSLFLLDEQAKILSLQKNQIEFQLAQVREAEAGLIDRIKQETGEELDLYKITQDLTNEAITVH